MATKSRRTLLLVCLVAFSILGALAAGGFFAIQSARQAAWRAARMNSLKWIGLGFCNYNDAYKRLPPAVRTDEVGRPLCSWRFYLLPFLENRMLDIEYGGRWIDPINRWLCDRPHPAYCLTTDTNLPKRLCTNVVAVTGPGTAFDGDRKCRLADIDSDTILVIEIAHSNTHWAEPGDLHIDDAPESIVAGLDGRGVCVLFADASVWYLRRDVPLEDLKKFFTVEGARRHDREALLGPYAGEKYKW